MDERPTAARMYHYYLSGEAVHDVDKVFGEQVLSACPIVGIWARHNREFLQRATRFMVDQGIRQFVDIGSGLPTAGNTHEVARVAQTGIRVAYVDHDRDAVDRSRELLRERGFAEMTTMLEADLHEPEAILDHPETRRLIDLREPLGVLIVSVWPFFTDLEEPLRIMARLRDRLPAGSYVAMSHVTLDDLPDEVRGQLAVVGEMYRDHADPVTFRTRAGIAAFFDGLDLVDPGLVYAPDWRPDAPVDPADPARTCHFAGVGHKR